MRKKLEKQKRRDDEDVSYYLKKLNKDPGKLKNM
jgi:hypothetical protein